MIPQYWCLEFDTSNVMIEELNSEEVRYGQC